MLYRFIIFIIVPKFVFVLQSHQLVLVLGSVNVSELENKPYTSWNSKTVPI